MNEYGRYPLQICITYLLKTPTLYDHSMTISDKMQKKIAVFPMQIVAHICTLSTCLKICDVEYMIDLVWFYSSKKYRELEFVA